VFVLLFVHGRRGEGSGIRMEDVYVKGGLYSHSSGRINGSTQSPIRGRGFKGEKRGVGKRRVICLPGRGQETFSKERKKRSMKR